MYKVQATIHGEKYSGETFPMFADANKLMGQLHSMGIPAIVLVLLDDKDEHGGDVWVKVGR